MNKHKKTTGVVLKRFNLNEADQIITIITKNEGKISVIAKNSRRLKSKFCGRLEPFYHLDLNYFQGRDLGYLNEVDILHAYIPLESGLKTKSTLFYIAEVTAKLVAEGQVCTEVYELLTDCLNKFEESCNEVMLHAYMIKLLTKLGFMAPWDTCNRSDEKIDLSKPHFLSVQNASIIQGGYATTADMQLTPSVIKWINYMQKSDFDLIKRVRPNHEERSEVSFIIQSIFGQLVNYPFKSEAFLRSSAQLSGATEYYIENFNYLGEGV